VNLVIINALINQHFSVPFLSLKHFLTKLDMKSSPLEVINNFCLVIVYFIVRICVLPYVYCVYASQQKTTLTEVIFQVPLKCHIGSLVLFSFQMFWFKRIANNLLQTVHNILQGERKRT